MTVNAFLDGLAQMVADAGIGEYNTTGVYSSGQVGVTLRSIPTAPDQVVSLSPRSVQDTPLLNDSVLAVQFRHRGAPNDPRGIQDRDDAVFDLLQGRQRYTVGGLFVVVSWRQGGGPLGQDTNQRWELASTFYFQTNNPTTYRAD